MYRGLLLITSLRNHIPRIRFPWPVGLNRSVLMSFALTSVFAFDFDLLQAQDQELATIRDGYVRTMTTLQNVLCDYEVEFIPPEEGFLNIPKQRQWTWAFEGSKWHLSCQQTIRPEGNVASASLNSVDGEFQWWIKHVDSTVRRKSHDDGYYSIQIFESPGRILGMYFNIGKYQVPDLTIQNLLNEKNANIKGKESIDGHECWRIDFKYPGREPEHDVPMTVWLDPDAGFLPRRLHDFEDQTTTVTKFRRVSSADGGESIPFPETVLFESPLGNRKLTVTALTINSELPQTLFRPKVPLGYRFYDLDDARQLDALRNRAREAARAKNQAIRQSSASTLPVPASHAQGTFDASPRRPSYRLWILAFGGFAVFVVCSVSLWKTRSR